jgi:hypothetical protein
MSMTTTTPTQPTNTPPSTIVASSRLTLAQSQRLDEIAALWGCTRAEVFSKFVDASHTSEVLLPEIKEHSFRRHAVLPKARRYKLVAPWKGLIGVMHYDYTRGTILSPDLHGWELLQQLYERDAALEPLPD